MRPPPVYAFTPWEIARRYGPVEGLKALVYRVMKVSPVVIIAWDITGADESVEPGDGIRPAASEDGALFDSAGFPAMLEKKLAHGPGWISTGNDGLRAWNFLDTKETQLANWLIVRTADPKSVWSVGTWVSRAHRGGGLANRIRRPAVRWCRDRGYRELIGWINLTNHSSLRASHKIGYAAVGRVVFMRQAGFALVRHGKRWRFGRWTAARPLVLSLEELRQDFGPPAPLLDRQTEELPS